MSLLHRLEGPQKQARPGEQGRLVRAAAPFATHVLGAEDRTAFGPVTTEPGLAATLDTRHGVFDPAAC